MAEMLHVGLASPFEPISAEFAVSAPPYSGTEHIERSILLIYVLHGSLDVTCFEPDLPIGTNEALIVPATPMLDLTYRAERDAEWYALKFRLQTDRSLRSGGGYRPFLHVQAARPERLTDLIRRYVKEHDGPMPSVPILSHLIQLVLVELRMSAEDSAAVCGQGGLEVISSRVDAYIAAHYNEPISTLEIARELRYNPEYLERAYRRECRVSIREAILLRRVKEARAQLLLEEARRVSDIARMCGFNDISHFRRVFKKAMNMTPHRFRSMGCSPQGLLNVHDEGAHALDRTEGDLHRPAAGQLRRTGRNRFPRFVRRSNPGTIEALNGGFFVSSGYGTHARRVLDSYELIFVTQGCLELYEGETSYRVAKNHSLLLFPGQVHGGIRPFEADLNFYWIHFRLRDSSELRSFLWVPKTTEVSDPELLSELFCIFISDQESASLSSDSAGSLIALMLCVVAKSLTVTAGEKARLRDPRERSFLARAVEEFIDANYDRPISTAAIARELNFSPDYLERVYRDHGGKSIVRALHERRIQAAREHLRNRNGKNINEIAFACGYNDSGYFRRVFKRTTGLTPKQYRAIFVQTHINTH